MTKQQADDILGYVAQNLLSPMAFDGRPTSETWKIMIGTPFHNLCEYVYKMVDKPTKSDIILTESEVKTMTIARYDGYVFDAKRFLYAEVTGTGLNIYLEGAKTALSIRTKTQTEAREKLKDVQSVVNGALNRGGR